MKIFRNLTVCAGLGAAILLTASTAWAQGNAAPAGAPAIATLIVPKNLSYWEMFANATLIVKTVMLLLLGA